MSELAAAIDVRDHRFGAGRAFTVGIEEEYMLLDPLSLDLVPAAERLLHAEAGGAFAAHAAPELFASLLEFHTAPCLDVGAAGSQLRALRAHAVELIEAHGLRLACAGTHPFARFEEQPIMHRERYDALIDELQYAGRRELIYGLHVHVAIDDPDRAIHVVNALRTHLCELVALSANSPFWRGAATGFASCRHLMFAAFPRSGPPPAFRDYEEYATIVSQLVDAGVIEDCTRIWWDVRPHPRFGTVEVRVMDAVSSVEDAIALAAYVQALVAWCALGDGAACHPVIAAENKWRAARYGLSAVVVDPQTRRPAPIWDLIARTLTAIAPFARELTCDRELSGIERILCDGNGAERQLAAFAAEGNVRAVVRDIVGASRRC